MGRADAGTWPRRAGQPVSFGDIPNWRSDCHSAALAALLASCRAPHHDVMSKRLRRIDRALRALGPVAARIQRASDSEMRARRFFERHFRPFRQSAGATATGLLTGYFEPELAGAMCREAGYEVAIYRRPPELQDTINPVYRASEAGRRHPHAYASRREIDDGFLAGRGLELVYVNDAIAAYFMHVQGCGRIRLADGRVLRIGFDGKNGRPYTSIAKVLVERGELKREDVSLPVLEAWLRADAARAQALMQENQSFIFFKLNPALRAADGPIGAHGVPLSAGRSLAVDAALYPLGLPIFVTAPSLDMHGEAGFHRLMIAQDVGTAIKGAERGDIFWGSGAGAGQLAGTTKHAGSFISLIPRSIRRP